MKTRSTAFLLVAAAAASAVAVMSPQQRRPERIAPSRARSSYNYVSHRPQMETDYRNDHGSYPVNVHGSTPHQQRSWGGHWRYGYRGDHKFDQHQFAFGAYLYTPFGDAAYPSPWYYYPELPPYVPASSVVVEPDISFQWNQGSAYAYPGGGAGDDAALDAAVGAIQTAFSNHDASAITPLIPPGGMVAVFQDGHYDYSLHGSDFLQMVDDNLNDVETNSFAIDGVSHWDDSAIVRATQVVNDPDGGTDTVRQNYHLHRDGGVYVITDISTSR